MSPSLHFCLEVKREIQVRCAREVCKTIALKDTRAYGVLSSDLGREYKHGQSGLACLLHIEIPCNQISSKQGGEKRGQIQLWQSCPAIIV